MFYLCLFFFLIEREGFIQYLPLLVSIDEGKLSWKILEMAFMKSIKSSKKIKSYKVFVLESGGIELESGIRTRSTRGSVRFGLILIFFLCGLGTGWVNFKFKCFGFESFSGWIMIFSDRVQVLIHQIFQKE